MNPAAPDDPWHSSQAGSWAATTQLANSEWTWSTVPLDAPIHGFTVLPQPHVTIGEDTASLDGWGLFVQPADTHEDPLLTDLVSQHTSAYITDCLVRTNREAAHRSAVGEYITAYDRYMSSRGTVSLRAETVKDKWHKAHETLMASAVSALNAETGVLGECIQNAYLWRTGQVTAITVTFAPGPLVQEQSTHTSRYSSELTMRAIPPRAWG